MSGQILVCMRAVPARETALAWLADAGHAVTVAPGADEALDALADVDVSVVILDLAIDSTPGLDEVRRLRAATGAPIMVVCEGASDERALMALDLGADDYVCRTPDADVPLARKELLSRVSVALRRVSDTKDKAGEIVAGGIQVRLDNREVCVDGELVSLTPNEFQLLACLAAEPERVFTHEELLARIWGAHAVDRVHYLHVYVDRLRKHIEPEPGAPRRLISVRGVGYRLALPED